MLVIQQYLTKTAVVLALLTLYGCKLLTPLPKPTSLHTPRTFMERVDSTSVAILPIREFFTDPALIALLDTALQRNPDLSIAMQRIEAARAAITEREGALLPSVKAEASAGIRRFGKYTMDGVGNYDTNFSDNIEPNQRIPNPMPDYFLGARSSWEADLWGKLRTRRRAAYLRFLATQRGRQLIVTTLVADVARQYYELLTLDNQLEILRSNIELQEQAVETIVIQKEAGRANELAVRQFTAQLLNTKSLEVQIQQQIIEVETRINTLLGRFTQPITRGNPILKQTLPEKIAVGIPAQMLRRRPDIQKAELELAAAGADLQAARLAFLPSLSLDAYVGFNAFRSSVLFSPASLAYGLLAGLAAPVINRKALTAGQQRARAQNLEALYSYNKVVLNAYQEALLNMRTLDNIKKISTLKSEETSVLKQGVSIANDLFLAGYATYLEIITAQRSVLAAELDQTTIQQRQFTTLVDLYRSLGGGWE
jgi:outer membrane protein, multidrug efflux system